MRSLYIIGLIVLASTFLSAQNQRFIHKVFELDTAFALQLDLYGAYETELWAGNTVMVETKVSLYNASENILTHFIKEGRYEVVAELAGHTLLLSSKEKTRQPLGTLKGGTSREEVQVRVFIPEKMQPTGTLTWEIPESERPKPATKGDGG
ncbi:MAG TPA: hypothetical protein PKC76_12595 [Saprospiraceae bacterium]|nr:hypothetical protein [Saprospiraceae bacterium]HMP24968.1 hypothetical protein [Saprospiraceae bacterium]